MNVSVFASAGFAPLPECTADDVVRLLAGAPHRIRRVDAAALAHLDRRDADVLVLPYVSGAFSEAALQAMTRFHARGGSLLVLGDLPHRGAWYPYRNMQSSRWHLTRGNGETAIDGLTDAGRRILGTLAAPEFFRGKRYSALRVTAFPPDLTHSLIHRDNPEECWQATPVVAVERLGPAFMGARFAQVAFNGGEPRENAGGGYRRPWTYDPGLLTREWAGLGPLLARLVAWLKPVDLAVALEVQPVHGEDAAAPMVVRIRNLSDATQYLERLSVADVKAGRILLERGGIALQPGETAELRVAVEARPFGIHEFRAEACGERATATATAVERVIPRSGHDRRNGFGASTFWAFPEPALPEAFREFCRQLLRRGCQYIRVNIPWEDVEPEPGRYDWRIPDAMLAFAEQEGFDLYFWMFPTTRCSGLGDGGVPLWSLREAAIDRHGNRGYFPSLWSPLYQTHYFAMLDAFTRRYAQAARLKRFIYDFGNSDFPYGYFYYVNDTTLFDYSPHERAALVRYLREERQFTLEQVGQLFGQPFSCWGDVPVPFVEQPQAWRVYLEFREYSIVSGFERAAAIIEANAPDKAPPDPPGHGLGSISDVAAFHYEAKARHWDEEAGVERRYRRLAHSGREWGGEPWQVGGRFVDEDDALFNSLRLNAAYLSCPGPDLGIYGDDLARMAFIRRTVMGAERAAPVVAVMDRTGWNDCQSLAHVALRLDQSADLLVHANRHPLSCYRLLVLPPDDTPLASTHTARTALLLPSDPAWYRGLREAVEAGLTVLVFPGTGRLPVPGFPGGLLRDALGIAGVRYGERRRRAVRFPEPFGRGAAAGAAAEVMAPGDVWLADDADAPLLVRQALGRGAVLLAGYDHAEDSLDGAYRHDRDERIGHHTLPRLLRRMGLAPARIDTGQLYISKEIVRRGEREFALFFSHLPATVRATVRVRLETPARRAFDLSTGETFILAPGADGWQALDLPIHPRAGRYLMFLP